MALGVNSASNRNEYQEYFLGGKGGQCVRLTTYHHPVPLSRNLGTLTSWNPLGLSRPVMGMLYLFNPPPQKKGHMVPEPKQSTIQCTPEFFPGNKDTKFKNEWRYTYIHPYAVITCTGS